MFSENGIQGKVSAYACVQVLRMQYSLWEQVNPEPFFVENVPKEAMYDVYSITRKIVHQMRAQNLLKSH